MKSLPKHTEVLPNGFVNLTILLIPENNIDVQALKATLEFNASSEEEIHVDTCIFKFTNEKGYSMNSLVSRDGNLFTINCYRN